MVKWTGESLWSHSPTQRTTATKECREQEKAPSQGRGTGTASPILHMISLEIDMQLILYGPNRLYLWIDGEVIYVYNNN